MTYNSLLATGLIDNNLHTLIAEHADSIQIQELLCQAVLLRIIYQLSAHSEFTSIKPVIKQALELESWTDILSQIQKLDQTLAQNMLESIKKIEFVILNSLSQTSE